ncbi:hypothetical protein EBZ39_01255 [bacterium]|nr:hypothetical protein [bacterium]
MAKAPYVYSKFRITAEIAGTVFDDIVAISATFGLNSIPTASLTVAVGYDAASGGTREATIHKLRKQIKPRDRVKVWLDISTEAGQTDKMESDTFLIFEGMVAGIGYQRSHNSANYVLQLIHWLDDLNNSSALNGKWFQNAPFLMATNAAFLSLQKEGTTTSPVPIIDANGDIIKIANIANDLWALVIKPIFEALCTYDLSNGRKNDAALKALEKMAVAGGKTGAPPLGLNLAGLEGNNITLAMRSALTKDALESFAYTSFWGKLVGEYAPQFFFAVSPAIEHASVIPFFGGLKHDGNKTYVIKADDYSYANFNATMSQLIDSVVAFWPWQMDPMLGIGGKVKNSALFTNPAGQYPPPENFDEERAGLKLFKDLPSWLASMAPWPIFTGPTTGIKGPAPGDCLARGEAKDSPPPDWYLAPDVAQQIYDGAGERFAEHFYKTEFLSQRYGELSGKLRFDIAPGSIVRIELPDSEIQSDGAIIAAVTQVSYAINAERALAGTSFALSYTRTEEEDEDTKYISQTYPPLYREESKWPGGPLGNI